MTRQRELFSVSVFIILKSDDRICLLKRHGTGWLDGHFSLPAGALDAGEAIDQAAIREAHEEVGIRLSAVHLRYVHVVHCLTEGESWFGHFFAADQWEGAVTVCEPDKHSELVWATIDRLPQPMVPYVELALAAVRNNISYSNYGWPAVGQAASTAEPLRDNQRSAE